MNAMNALTLINAFNPNVCPHLNECMYAP